MRTALLLLPLLLPASADTAQQLGGALPNCSVVFFHHIEKTGGTTLRAIFQRHAQLGLYDLVSFVGRQNRLQLQLVLHRLHSLVRAGPAALHNLRLAVELHVAGDLVFPYTLYYTLPDLLLMRSLLRAAGCRCHLVSLLRMPLLQQLSWHGHFVNVKAPLCFWKPASSCGTRMALGLTCHDAPRVPPLTEAHALAADGMWRLFDLVGVTERFDEFLLMLSDLVGLPNPAYRAQLVDRLTASASTLRVRRWSAQRCSKLVAAPPPGLLQLVGRKLNASREQADRLRRPMECWTYGCQIGSRYVGVGSAVPYQSAACAAVDPMQVLTRLCATAAGDERAYLLARARFKQRLATHLPPPQRKARLKGLHAANDVLAARAARQRRRGLPGHEAARSSCVGCSGDVVPEFDLGGCWPLWAQFAPDERRFRCSRNWTTDPAYRDPAVRPGYKEKPIVLRTPLACWRTCWEPSDHAMQGDVAHCTARCPSTAAGGAEAEGGAGAEGAGSEEEGAAPLPLAWRSGFDAELAAFKASSAAARAYVRLAKPFAARAVGGWHSAYLTRQIWRVF